MAGPDVQVATPVFTGPIDLLLTLATRQEVDLNLVRLADLTGPYLAAMESQDPAPAPEEMAAFLLVGSKLLALKAAALLPGPRRRSTGTSGPGRRR